MVGVGGTAQPVPVEIETFPDIEPPRELPEVIPLPVPISPATDPVDEADRQDSGPAQPVPPAPIPHPPIVVPGPSVGPPENLETRELDRPPVGGFGDSDHRLRMESLGIGRSFGVGLLWILAVALTGVILFGYDAENARGRQLGDVTLQVTRAMTLAAGGPAASRLEDTADVITSALAVPAAQPSIGLLEGSALRGATRTLIEAVRNAALAPHDREVLRACVTALPLPASEATRNAQAIDCVFVLRALAAEMTAASDADRLRAAGDTLKQLREAHQEQRGHWQQIGQMVLLNLLLPLLTLLFGYVFGNQQGRAAERAQAREQGLQDRRDG